MKKLCSVIILVFLILAQAGSVFSQNIFSEPENEISWDLAVTRGFGSALLHGLIATAELMVPNYALMYFNQLYGFYWAHVSFDSIRENLAIPGRWYWEYGDAFITNQVGHPYQGGLYVSAGRVNGFGFYESLFFGLLGSYHYEVFSATISPGVNDLIYTSVGGLVYGEILYRMYIEAHSRGVPAFLTFLINPIAGLHRLITPWEPPYTASSLHYMRFSLGSGYGHTSYKIDTHGDRFSFDGFFGNLALKIIYGDPFQQETNRPYRHFEFQVGVGMNPGNYSDYRFTSDAYLMSFSPIQTERSKLSTGLSFSMDYFQLGEFTLGEFGPPDSTINHASLTLGWSVKNQFQLSDNIILESKYLLGINLLGVSQFNHPDIPWVTQAGILRHEFKNYGYGLTSRGSLTLIPFHQSRFEIDLYHYAMWTYPGTSPRIDSGFIFWQFIEISYIYNIYRNISLGVNCLLSLELGFFPGVPDTSKVNNSFKLFMAWNF